IGRKKSNLDILPLKDVEPFRHFFDNNGNLKYNELDMIDGAWTRREVLARYLLLSAVLDQGPDIHGVRELLKNVTNVLYRKEIRIFHRPIDFFRELNISINEILETHKSIKKIRAEIWAKYNKSNPNKYNLFFAQSQRGIISINQVLDYSIHRWGVPLCVPLLLEKDLRGRESFQPLIEHLESFPSSEIMSIQLKQHERYGLGSAIGNKAAHLFAKWYIHTFKLSTKKESGWSKWSFEVPFDSNAGRVLFRTGFFTILATLKDYEKWGVIQKNKGKGKTHYIRVTNIRGKKVQNKKILNQQIIENYNKIITQHLKIRKRSSTLVEIQHIPNAILLNSKYGIGDFDDGLIYIGTNFCFNHDKPKCKRCPLKDLCMGNNWKTKFIKNYRT
ncbi:hypothetical protein J7K41_00630, partial [Candidatus Micrarchaeota archaeon]|nr:hypothetical protein [Candidatus Micrarchaeota archaeon]